MTKESAAEELVKAVHKILGGYVSDTLAEKLASSVRQDLTRPPHEPLSDREYEVMRRIGKDSYGNRGRIVTQR